MCVCLYKPAGRALPSNKTLFRCYAINRDGMGFATPTSVYHSMRYEDFFEALKQVPKADPCIIHFRWATHGSVRLENCHPFVKGNVVFAHNGVLPIQPIGDMTDSETAFKTIVYPAIQDYGFKSEEADRIINATAQGSRFAIMVGKDVQLIGDWHYMNGIYYSNLNWCRYM